MTPYMWIVLGCALVVFALDKRKNEIDSFQVISNTISYTQPSRRVILPAHFMYSGGKLCTSTQTI